MTKQINTFIKEAHTNRERVYFDVDGTLIQDGVLTPLGKWVRDQKMELHILTFGPWNKTMLQTFGLHIKKLINIGTALQIGCAECNDNGVSKKVGYLIDNEPHSLSAHVLQVNFK